MIVCKLGHLRLFIFLQVVAINLSRSNVCRATSCFDFKSDIMNGPPSWMISLITYLCYLLIIGYPSSPTVTLRSYYYRLIYFVNIHLRKTNFTIWLQLVLLFCNSINLKLSYILFDFFICKYWFPELGIIVPFGV